MISIRNSKFAKIGLVDMINYIQKFSDTKNMSMVEIGTYVGDSAEIFSEYFKIVYCVDPWLNGYDENDMSSYLHDMKVVESQFTQLMLNKKNLRKKKKYSADAAFDFKDYSLDFVYIDGLHTDDGETNDLKCWLPKIKPGGFIGGHDYGSKHFVGVKKAIDRFFIPDKTFRDTSWIKQV